MGLLGPSILLSGLLAHDVLGALDLAVTATPRAHAIAHERRDDESDPEFIAYHATAGECMDLPPG